MLYFNYEVLKKQYNCLLLSTNIAIVLLTLLNRNNTYVFIRQCQLSGIRLLGISNDLKEINEYALFYKNQCYFN